MGPRVEYSDALDFLPSLVFLSFKMGVAFPTKVSRCFRQSQARDVGEPSRFAQFLGRANRGRFAYFRLAQSTRKNFANF